MTTTTKTVAQLFRIVRAANHSDLGHMMQDRAQQELRERFEEWCKINRRPDDTFETAEARWMRENGVDDVS